MKSSYILSFVIIILCGSLIFGSTQNIKLNNRVNFLLNQMDTMAGLLKDAYALEGKWKHKYDSVVKKMDSFSVNPISLTGDVIATPVHINKAETVNIGN